MKIDAARILKTGAKASFYILTRMIGFGLFGLMLNAIMLFLLRPEMGIIADRVGPVRMDAGGGAMAVIILFVLVVAYWPITLMVLGFGICFPALYFVLGQKHGIKKAIHYIISDNREFIMEYTVDRLWDHAARQSGIQGKVDATLSGPVVREILPRYLKRLDNMPRPLRRAARLVIARIDLAGIVTKIIEQKGEDRPLDFNTLASAVKEKASAAVEEKFFAPNLVWFWILSSVNLASCIILKIAL